MQSKNCLYCNKLFSKTSNLSQKVWETSRKYCSNRCKAKVQFSVSENHPQWKGDEATYTVKHQWVYRHLGKAKNGVCENCGGTRHLQWSNKSGQYMRSIDDWQRLCISCHIAYDRTVLGREFLAWNKGKHIRLNPKGEFKKGSIPWNKGLNVRLNPKGEFKKGQVAWNKKERIMIFCKCGCGEMLMNINQYGNEREYIFRHFYKRNSVEK